MDTTKTQQATEIIASQIAKLPANTPMDHGTLGALKGSTKRESEAYSMALYFVKAITGLTFENLDMSDEQKEALKVVDEIAAAAVAKTGK